MRRRDIIWPLLCCAVLITGCADVVFSEPAARSGRIEFIVVDHDTGTPLEDVQVAATSTRRRYEVGTASRTNANGRTVLPFRRYENDIDIDATARHLPETLLVSFKRDGYYNETVSVYWNRLEEGYDGVSDAPMVFQRVTLHSLNTKWERRSCRDSMRKPCNLPPLRKRVPRR